MQDEEEPRQAAAAQAAGTAAAAQAEEEDDRYASQRAVCMAAHRTLLLSPVLGLGCRLGRHCVPVLEIPHRSSGSANEGAAASSPPLYTWKGLNSIFVTLLKHSADATAIYVHPSDMHYHASPQGSLGPGCPVGTALLAQVVLDRTAEPEWGVSVLIFDALQIGADDLVQMQVPPLERYMRLRHLCTACPNVLVSPAMKLQWAGEYGALKQFCCGPGSREKISHIPDGFMQYTQKHPCKIVMLE